MITFEEARKIVQTILDANQTLKDQLLVIIDEDIIEKDYAWVFPYTTKKFLETGDMSYGLGGNSPFFISRFDGRISRYRTGLSMEGMIDEHEEINKIWSLNLTDNIFNNTNKTLAFRKILGLQISEIATFKKNYKAAFETGSRTRLMEIQKQLCSKGIVTSLIQKTLTENHTTAG